MISDDERIATLRVRVLDRKEQRNHTSTNMPWLLFWRAVAAAAPSSTRLKLASVTKLSLENCPFEVDELELLAGRPVFVATPKADAQPDFEALKKLSAECGCCGQTGHAELWLDKARELGVAALLRDIEAREKKASSQEEKDELRCFALALEGFSTMIRNAAKACEKAMDGVSAERKAELVEMAESCKRIASEPPKTFRDALQLLWFAIMGVMYSNEAYLLVPGHIDRTLRKYYEADKKAGILDDRKALLLVESLYLLINDMVADGLAMSVLVGGRDENGKDLSNGLSFLCLEALRRTKLCYPTTGVCWHKGTPEKLTDLAVELVSKGYTTPAFFGDETIQKGLKSYGAASSDACNYINSTCVEITPVGASNVWVASPYFPLCKILMDEIAEQVAKNAQSASFELFLESYFKRLSGKIDEAAEGQNRCRQARFDNNAKPLQSVFTRDCLARGKDINRGGALYNWVECSFVGIANLADSLYVIKKEVFETKAMTLAKIKEVLDANFKGFEDVRQKFLNVHPKYGMAVKEVDDIAGLVVAHFSKECSKHKIKPDDAHFIPGAFCWIMHEHLGRDCGATPDGRLAGFPFADGAGPAQGREVKGPTGSVLSTSSWDHSHMIGGTALNMKFSSGLFKGGKGCDNLKALVKTYLERGGVETQINVVDRETLLKAKANPEQYRDLVVRIGGYTDYFTRLSKGMQDEVLLRTEFSKF